MTPDLTGSVLRIMKSSKSVHDACLELMSTEVANESDELLCNLREELRYLITAIDAQDDFRDLIESVYLED